MDENAPQPPPIEQETREGQLIEQFHASLPVKFYEAMNLSPDDRAKMPWLAEILDAYQNLPIRGDLVVGKNPASDAKYFVLRNDETTKKLLTVHERFEPGFEPFANFLKASRDSLAHFISNSPDVYREDEQTRFKVNRTLVTFINTIDDWLVKKPWKDDQNFDPTNFSLIGGA